MEAVIYLDIFFLTDFFFNFLVLLLAGAMGRRKARPVRAAAAAAVGSLWNCSLLMWPVFPRTVETVLTMVVVGALMSALAFGKRRIARDTIFLWIATILLGGTMAFFRQLFWMEDWEFLVMAGAAAWLLRMGAESLLRGQARGRERYPVRLYYRGRRKELVALADSGNRLREPVSQKPVSVMSYGDCIGFCESVSSVRYIPYRAVGTEEGALPAVTFEKMEIFCREQWITVENPIVAVSKGRLSSSGDFSMLLPEELVL